MQRFYTGSLHLRDMLLTANYRNHSRVNFPIQRRRRLGSVAVSKSPHLCGGALRMFPPGLQCTDSEGVAKNPFSTSIYPFNSWKWRTTHAATLCPPAFWPPTHCRPERGASFNRVQGLVLLWAGPDEGTTRCSLVANLDPLKSLEPDWAGGSKNRLWFHTPPPPRWPAQLPLSYFVCRHICPSEESSQRKRNGEIGDPFRASARLRVVVSPRARLWFHIWEHSDCICDPIAQKLQVQFNLMLFIKHSLPSKLFLDFHRSPEPDPQQEKNSPLTGRHLEQDQAHMGPPAGYKKGGQGRNKERHGEVTQRSCGWRWL